MAEALAVLRTRPRMHLLGVGGVGMSALAEWLMQRGIRVSGSDREESPTLERLRGLGAVVHAGHDPAQLADAEAVVYSAAIPEGHPVRAAARARGLPQVHRAAMLAALATGGRVLAVAGTHGKTTTTAALAAIWTAAGHDPTAVVGGAVSDWEGRNLRLGESPWRLLEADESDGSFLHLRPEAIALTSAEPDHLDHHGSPEALERAYGDFVGLLPPEGALVFCADDPGAARIGARRQATHPERTTGYGEGQGAQLRVTVETMAPGRTVWRVTGAGGELELVSPLMGHHNALNLTAALGLARLHGIPDEAAREGLAGFHGVARRQEYIGEAAGYAVYDDYAHHPTEVRATLAAFRAVHGGPLTVVFQPHLYSRTAHFERDFAEALRPADRVIVTEVYAAREAPLPGVSGAGIVRHLTDHPAASFEPDWRDVPARLPRPGSGVLLTLGAGDVTRMGREWVAAGGGRP